VYVHAELRPRLRGWRSASRVCIATTRYDKDVRVGVSNPWAALWWRQCSSDVKWRIHPCHMSIKSKPSGLGELRQLGRWTDLESYSGVGYVIRVWNAEDAAQTHYCQRHPPCLVRLVLGPCLTAVYIIRLVGYRYDIVGIWWGETCWNARFLYSRGWNSFWPGQSDDALLVLSYQYCEFQSQGRRMTPRHPRGCRIYELMNER